MRPSWGQLREFCLAQGYQETRTDHFRYQKVLPGRMTSGTMVSFGVDSETIPPQFWTRMWKRQLRLLDEDQFWRGLAGQPVQYNIPPPPEPQQPLPDFLARHLPNVEHWSEERIAQTTRDEAQAVLNAYYADQLREP
jgi:hypothetical protein